MAKPAQERLELAGYEVGLSEPRQGLFSRCRHHETRARAATTWQSSTVRCAASRGGRWCSSATSTAPRASRSIRSARRRSGRRSSTSRRSGFRRADTPTSASSTTPRRSRGSSTSAASSCIRTPCARATWTDPTSCASISIRCRASRGRRSSTSRRSRRTSSTSSGSSVGRRPAARAARTSGCGSRRSGRFTTVRRAALAFAREIERRAPAIATAQWWKEERRGVFLDYNQNARDRTTCSVYSVRATPDARVSMPLAWDEFLRCDPRDFTLRTVPAIFAARGDAHAAIDAHPGRLDALLELADRQEAAGVPDAPWPPHHAKAPGEAPRVAPSRARKSKLPVITIAQAKLQARCASRARALEGAPSRGRRAARARGHPRRHQPRPRDGVVPRANQPQERAPRSASTRRAARSRLRSENRVARKQNITRPTRGRALASRRAVRPRMVRRRRLHHRRGVTPRGHAHRQARNASRLHRARADLGTG